MNTQNFQEVMLQMFAHGAPWRAAGNGSLTLSALGERIIFDIWAKVQI